MTTQLQETQNEALVQAYSTLALEALNRENEAVRQFLSNRSDVPEHLRNVLRAATPTQQYTYNVNLNYAAFWIAYVELYFTNPDSGKHVGRFYGCPEGPFSGIGATWGTAWLNVPIETLRGKKARCLLTFAHAFTSVFWKTLDGETIGSFVGGGLGIGGGVAGGEGTFSQV